MSKCESKCESPCRKSCESKQGGSAGTADSAPRFIDRRRSGSAGNHGERRQFGSSHAGLSPEATELAVAIDRYKLARRRRYITCEEMLAVIKELGYCRPGSQP